MDIFWKKKSMTVFVTVIIWISLMSNIFAYALPAVPESIQIGLNYGTVAANDFNLKSGGGLELGIADPSGYNKLFDYQDSAGINIRKDVYYNIVNNKVTAINYVEAAIYNGEVTGPFHIQLGDVYPDMNAAKQVADRAISITPSVFLAYEGGWKVWAQRYLNEGECQQQIALMKNEMPDLNYSIVYPDKKRIQILNGVTDQILYIINADNPVVVAPKSSTTTGLIEYNKLKYRGKIVLKRLTGSDITVINELPMEQYLYGVIPSEMPYSWHTEALKAQAVSARNYAIANLKKHNNYGFDLCNGQDCQVYKGYSNENSKTNEAVDATKGRLLTYNGSLVSAYFHSSSGGYTENSEDVWGSVVPYLKAVDDKYGLGSPYDNWTKAYSKDEIKAKLVAAQIDIGDITDIVPLSVSAFGRVTKVEVRGTNGRCKTLELEKIRSVLGYSDIKSTWYTIETDADIFIKDNVNNSQKTRASGLYIASAAGVSKLSSADNKTVVQNNDTKISYNISPLNYTFCGKGWGHGLGMSQYGAKGMAEAGFNYKQILEYYFTGSKIQ